MSASDRYLASALAALTHASTSQAAAIRTAASWVADAVAADGMLFVTGSGHSHMLAEEVFYRAGGLLAVHPILDPALMLHEAAVTSTAVERRSGIADALIEAAGVGAGDVLVIASNSGRNAYPVEAAMAGRRLGARVVALTSLPHARSVASRHPSGAKLFELADLVLDTGIEPGDAALALGGLDAPVGPLSTVVGAALINAVVVQAVETLLARGHVPDVLRSANVDAAGGDGPDLGRWARRVPALR